HGSWRARARRASSPRFRGIAPDGCLPVGGVAPVTSSGRYLLPKSPRGWSRPTRAFHHAHVPSFLDAACWVAAAPGIGRLIAQYRAASAAWSSPSVSTSSGLRASLTSDGMVRLKYRHSGDD